MTQWWGAVHFWHRMNYMSQHVPAACWDPIKDHQLVVQGAAIAIPRLSTIKNYTRRIDQKEYSSCTQQRNRSQKSCEESISEKQYSVLDKWELVVKVTPTGNSARNSFHLVPVNIFYLLCVSQWTFCTVYKIFDFTNKDFLVLYGSKFSIIFWCLYIYRKTPLTRLNRQNSDWKIWIFNFKCTKMNTFSMQFWKTMVFELYKHLQNYVMTHIEHLLHKHKIGWQAS